MEIQQIQDKNYAKIWDNFIIENSSPSCFLQSWAWGENKTQNSINNEQGNLLRFGVFENEKLIAVAQFFKIKLPGKKFYLNCPKGPIIKTQNSDNSKQVFDLLKNRIEKIDEKPARNAKQSVTGGEKIVFFRIAPPYEKSYQLPITNYQLPKILVNLKEPENTLILNLKKSEEEILENMHPKTRYNIRLAEKKEVKIRIGNEKDIDIFYKLLQETAQRDNINIFNKEYYKKLLITNYQLPITLFIAEHNNIPLSAILVIGFGNTATYLHGASSNEKRNLMPNYLIQWQAIKWAKANNYKYYDFWGITPINLRINAHKFVNKWKGITKFKKGFVSEKTGKEINYVGTFDFILNKKWYNLYRLAKFFTL